MPICGGCATLEIDCHYHAVKPDWMDNGQGQRQMMQQIKSQVKQSAKRRRGIAQMETIAKELYSMPAANPVDIASNPHDTPLSNSPRWFELGGSSSQASPSPRVLKDQPCQERSIGSLTSQTELGMGFITGYMDYVLPSLYPFYNPSVLDGGRTWILVLAMKNTAFFSSIVSLSSYFFSIVPVVPGPDHAICAAVTWEELQTQVAAALSIVQHDLMALGRRGVGNSLLDSVSLMANILQYLGFEMAIRSGKWKLHLEAATNLFLQILEAYGDEDGERGVRGVLKKLDRGQSESMYKIPNADQNSFRFFSSILVIDNILASTSLGRPSRLSTYHFEIEPPSNSNLQILSPEEILGCQPWVLLALSDVAALDAWKHNDPHLDTFKATQISSRAASIESRIRLGIKGLDELMTGISDPAQKWDVLVPYRHCNRSMRSHERELAGVTRIWAYAIHTYLRIVLHGWQMSDDEIRKNTLESIQVFKTISSPFWLRSMVWPFCISGCVALPEEREAFQTIGNSLEAMQAFGTTREALSILETVWSKTDTCEDSWTIGDCLKSFLGYPVLLV